MKVKTRIDTITTNTILSSEDYGGWQAVNVGDTPAVINGVLTSPDSAVVGVDYTQLAPSVIWDEQIRILFDKTAGGSAPKVVVTRLKYIE